VTALDDQHIQAAAQRAPIACTMPDGRTITGRLIYWPHHGRSGRARIQLASGAYLSVRPDQIRILETST
jgi:hypothetical protein